MLQDLHKKICHHIHCLTQHPQQYSSFTSKKNDHLLQNFIDDLMQFSDIKMCSDIHIEPQEHAIRIRLRVDGVLSEQFQLPKFVLDQLCGKLKIVSNLNIAQSRLPQDGKFLFEYKNGMKTHVRISTCPTIYGEKIVLRLLKDHKTTLDLHALGMNSQQLRQFTQAINHPYGLILITGPTGSGKTSTLYSALHNIDSNAKNVMTIEDPVEVHLTGINQIHVKNELNFATVLRSILRQDPDIIMIGEIRDEETAQIAIQAANTGHLVFATLHTNNCIESINRLKHMNIDQHDLISCLKLIVSQRLLRKKCTLCHSQTPNEKCVCNDGYLGRIGIFEMLSFNESLKAYILDNAYCHEQELIQQHQFSPINQQALDYITAGITTTEEMKRALNVI